jgi:hypothetical protein
MRVKKPDGGENDLVNFPLPRPAGDGSCDLKSGPSFLFDMKSETCSFKINSLATACSDNGAL